MDKNLPELKTDSEAEDFVDTADLSEYDFSKFEKVRFEMVANKDAQRAIDLLERLSGKIQIISPDWQTSQIAQEMFDIVRTLKNEMQNALQTQAELVEALNSIDGILTWMANDEANYTAGELRGMAKKALEFKKQAITKAEQGGRE